LLRRLEQAAIDRVILEAVEEDAARRAPSPTWWSVARRKVAAIDSAATQLCQELGIPSSTN
jgi:hypothetical protein